MKPMKMTTPIPEGLATPDRVETLLGTLRLEDGVPDEETTRKVFDNLDLQRATQAYLDSIQIASMEGLRRGILGFGPANETVIVFQDRMDSRALWLTPNDVSVYVAAWMEIGDEPMVVETPPNVLGFIDDAWFQYVVDFGNAGPDRGEGGRFLILPPGYDGEVPDGFHVARTHTRGNWVVWRGQQVDGSPATAVRQTKERFRLYPLSRRDAPPAMDFVEVSGVPHNTIHRMDYGFWEEVDAVVQRETTLGLSPELRGQLASIGIQKGKPFAPDARMKKILEEAAHVGAVTVRALAARPRDRAFYFYPGESHWMTPFVGGSYTFLEDDAKLLDARAFFHFYATGITPAMTMAPVGSGSQYAALYLDSEGRPFDGSKTYSCTLPKDIPVNNFWSLTLYDNQTRSMLQTDQTFPARSGLDEGLQANDDGSVTILFGPEPPAGREANWIQTVPGKGWNVILRLYGPLEPWFDKTWRPGDIVRVE